MTILIADGLLGVTKSTSGLTSIRQATLPIIWMKQFLKIEISRLKVMLEFYGNTLLCLVTVSFRYDTLAVQFD